MARISTYDQDSTLNKLDKVVGTDSATGATKNYTIQSLMGLVNAEDLIDVFDGVSYTFKSFDYESTNPRGIINLNTGTAVTSPFSGISRIYISALDKQGNSVGDYLDDTVNSFIRIVQKNNINVYGVFEVTDVTNYENGAYKLLTVISRTENGNIIANEDYFISNYSAVFDQDFSDDSVTEFSDVTSAGSGQIITNAERTSLNNFTANGLLHADVVDNVTSTATDVPLSANQGKILKDFIDSLTALLDVDEADKPALDTLREVVNFCQINEATLSSLGISNIAGLQAALDSKQNTEVGKGLSANDFTTALLTKLNGIAAGAQVNVKSNWTAGAGTDAEILNKPSDLTNLTIHSVTELNDVTSAGSGAIITSAERTKLQGIEQSADVTDTTNVTAAGALMDSEVTNLDDVKSFNPADYATAAQGTLADNALPKTGGAMTGAITTNSTFDGRDVSVDGTKLDTIETNADVTDTANVTSAGALMDSEVTNLAQVKAFDAIDYATAAQGTKADSAQQPPAEGPFVDGDKTKLDNAASTATTIELVGTTNEIEVTPTGAQDLSTDRTFTVSLPDDVTIGEDLKVNETIELVNAQTTTPTFDNGIYYSTEDAHDTLHFRYHGHDLSIDHLTENIPTGILNGGELSTNTSTTFDVTAGDGVINILNKDNSDPHPEIKKVEWAATTITHTLGNASETDQLNTWVYVDSSGNVQQTLTAPTPNLWRSNIVLGSVIHSENVIRFVKTFPRPAYSNGNTVAEFIEIFGPLKKSGHLLTVNSTNDMALDRSLGVSFALGRNYETDAEEPNLVSDSASTPVFHRYSSTSTGFTKDDGASGAGYTDIDPTKYDNNGTLTNVSSGHYSVQRLFHFPNNTNVIVAYYGKADYNSIDNAEKNYLLEDFQEADNTSSQAIYLGALVVKGNATDLGDSSEAKILTGGIFRSLSAANLGGVAVNAALNDLIDVNITGVANNEVLQYNSSTGDWENGVGISGTGTANKLAIWSDASTLTGDVNLHWDTTNDRLGIGTSSPNAALEVHNTLNVGDGTSVTSIGLQRNSANYITATDAAGYLVFRTGGSNERLRIDSGGNVGIGTTSPGSKLDILSIPSAGTGTILNIGLDASNPTRAKIHTETYNGVFSLYDSGNVEDVKITSKNGEDSWINNGGNVGIGTSSPDSLLHTYSSGNNTALIEGGSSDIVTLEVKDGTNKLALTKYTNSHNEIRSTGNVPLLFKTNGNNERMRITSNGNVGIGTTSPTAAKLQVNGSISSDISGSIGWAVNDNFTWNNFSSTAHYGLTRTTTLVGLSGYYGLGFLTQGSEKMRIEQGGNVGIGTTSPTSALHVAGKTRSTDGFTADGNTKKYFWRGSNTSNSGTIWKHIATMNLVGHSTRIKITGAGSTSYAAGHATGHFTILAQVNNNNQLEGTWFTENGTYTVQDVYIINNGSYSYSVYIQTGGYSEFAFEAVISQGAVSTNWTTVSTPTGGASLTKQWDVNQQLYVNSSGNLGIGTSSPSVKLDINSTDAIKVPAGTTAQRPTAANGMLRYNSEDAQFEGYADGTWGAIAGSGGGSGEIVKQTFSATGSATFTLANTIADIDNISVYVSGVYQYPSNYTISGANITFVSGSIPAAGTNNVHVVHTTTVASITEVGSVFVDQFTGNGSATQFSPLGTAPTGANNTDVYIDGVYQQKNAYSIAGSQITFTDAPETGAYIEVKTTGTIAPAAVNAVTTNLVSDSFTATADQTSFTLTNGTPSAKELTMVFVQGVYQAKANYSLLTSPTRIVLTEGAEVGETVEVISVSGANLTTSPVASVNGQTGAVTFDTYIAPTVYVINTNTTAVANSVYVLTANLTLTLPASPSSGDSIKISNRSGVATCVLARNGSNIMGSASDLTLDTASASFELIYSDATNGWVIIGQ